MSKLCFVMGMILMMGRSHAQNYPAPGNEPLTFFVLIQADDGQPFYIRLNNQLYSSSTIGHLILAQLADSVYTIAVGLPGFPEQRYLLNPHQKDLALRLRRQDDRWTLYDDQGQPVAKVADPAALEKPLLAGAKKDDAFSQLMSAIVQDTAVMYNTFAAAAPDSPQAAPLSSTAIRNVHDTIAPITSNINPGSPADPLTSHTAAMSSLVIDSVQMKPADTPATTNLANFAPGTPVTGTPVVGSLNPGTPGTPGTVTTIAPIAPTGTPSPGTPVSSAFDPAVPSSPTGVVKLSERKSSKSLSLVYADHAADKRADTIDVVIPIDLPTTGLHRTRLSDSSRFNSVIHRPLSTDSFHSTAGGRRPISPDTFHSRIPVADKNPKSDSPTLASAVSHKSSLPFVNSDCHAFATDYDVDKLRVHMLDANKEEVRIQVAYKVFKTKCFSTKQIRALSEVFTTDPAKFKFLATAYPFVSDDLFSELVSLLSDPVYARKFRTMTDRQ